MTRGRRIEKTYIGPNGAATDRMAELRKLEKTPAGRYGRVAAPDPDSLRQFITAQMCPWCGRGPWKVLAIHTHNAHGVSAAELRDIAGLKKQARICDEEHSRRASDRRRGQRLPDVAYERIKGSRRRYSEAGLLVQRAKLEAARPAQARTAGQATAASVMAKNAPKYREIIRLFQDGLLLKEIGERVGLHPSTVRHALRREGIEVDAFARRNQSADNLAKLAELRQQAKAVLAEQRRDMAERRIARFAELGSDWQALCVVAREWGMSRKDARAYLCSHGIEVPDGRSAAVSRFTDADLSAMAELYAEGRAQSEIARRFGTSQAYVSDLLRQCGVKARPFARSSRRSGAGA